MSHFSGTNKLASSAYFVTLFVEPNGFKSIIHINDITNKVGPIPEPCTIDRLMTRVNYHFCPILTNCVRSVKNEPTHCTKLSEILSDFNLLIKMMWSTESKAFKKLIKQTA